MCCNCLKKSSIFKVTVWNLLDENENQQLEALENVHEQVVPYMRLVGNFKIKMFSFLKTFLSVLFRNVNASLFSRTTSPQMPLAEGLIDIACLSFL